MEDKLLPSILYLQKLGQEHLQLVFDTARWIFAEDANMAFEVTAVSFVFVVK